MARYMEDDPFMVAAAELVEDVKLKRAEEDGRVWHPEAGLHFVNDAGDFEYVGSREDIADELADLYAKGYQEAYEQAYSDAVASPALGDEWANFQYDDEG